MISIVVAYSNNRVIGKNNKMPWDIKEDLEFFKNLTMGNIIVMGRKTYESIGRILPGRINIVISRKDESQNKKIKENLYFTKSLDDAVCLSKSLVENTESKINNINSDTKIKTKIHPKEIFIIGGQSIYEQSIDIADKIYVTKIDYDYDGDKYFPYFNEAKYSSKILKSVNLPVKHSFILYEKM